MIGKKSMNNKKIRMEIIPGDDVDADDLRDNVHNLIKNLKINNAFQCQSLRSWTETIKLEE